MKGVFVKISDLLTAVLHVQPVAGVQVMQSTRLVYRHHQFREHFVCGIYVAILITKQSTKQVKSYSKQGSIRLEKILRMLLSFSHILSYLETRTHMRPLDFLQ